MAKARTKPRTTPKARAEPPPTAGPAGRRFTDVEIAALAGAWANHDGATLERIGTAAGVKLALPVLQAMDAVGKTFSHEELLATIGDALAEPAGIAVREDHAFMRSVMCLVVAAHGTLVIGLARTGNAGHKLAMPWPQLRPWYRDLGRNAPRVEAWLAQPERDTYGSLGRFQLELVAVEPPREDTRVAELVAAIVADPADDTPRLVLADVLQQKGDPHGELIALACALPRARDDERRALSDRITRLQELHGERIAGDVARCTTEYRFARGFVQAVTMNASSFSANGERLLASHPIESLTLKPLTTESLAKLAKVPALSRIRSLWLDHDILKLRPVTLESLGASPHLARLRLLRLGHFITTSEDWIAAFTAMRAPALKILSISGGNFDLRALAALATSPGVPRLERISLSVRRWDQHDFVMTGAAEAFEALATRTSLRELDLERCTFVDADAIARLYAGPGGRGIEALAVTSKAFGDAALGAIVAAGECALRVLEVNDTSVTGAGLLELLQSPAGGRIEKLSADWGVDLQMSDLVDRLAKLPDEHPLRDLRLQGVKDYPARFA